MTATTAIDTCVSYLIDCHLGLNSVPCDVNVTACIDARQRIVDNMSDHVMELFDVNVLLQLKFH